MGSRPGASITRTRGGCSVGGIRVADAGRGWDCEAGLGSWVGAVGIARVNIAIAPVERVAVAVACFAFS